MGIPAVREWRINRHRAGASYAPALLGRYAYQAVRTLQRHGISPADRQIVEFGPGDTLSSGLALLAAGAASYTSLDRFVPGYSRPAAKRWYHGVRDEWATAFPNREWPPDINPARFPEAYPDRVGHIDGAVEDARTTKQFDLVMSWQVGEHVDDINAFATLTAQLLKPDGIAIHRVAFGPHDCWRDDYQDPWLFLRFPQPLWSMMGSNRGYPNRKRLHEFMAAWSSAGLQASCVETQRFDRTRTGKLPARYSRMPMQSIETQATVFICRYS